MLQKFLKSFSKVVKKDDTLIIAASGGIDSMVLLDLVMKHHKREKIIIAHFDHCLRGAESDGDRESIAKFCEKNNLTFESEKLDIAKLAKEEKKSIENTARTYRYEFLARIAKKYGAKYIFTAHHSDDRIETAIFNLIRGAKLGGIHALSDRSGKILRPLLNISKEEIRAYAGENNILFREDSTNTDTDYQRNYLRHEILPKFETINPEYRRALSNFIDYTEELKSWIDAEVKKFLGGKCEFSAQLFAEQSPFFQKEIVRYLYETTNNGTVGLSEGNIEEILRFITTAEGGTQKEVHGLFLSKQRQVISFTSGPFHQPGIKPAHDS